jgi:hypothetical protein
VRSADTVGTFLDELRHPLRAEIDIVRQIILGVSPEIQEGIKWNAPSYRTEVDDFATFNLRSQKVVQLVFHTGAKAKAKQAKMKIPDPAGLLDWRTNDRCLVTLTDVARQGPALASVVRAWVDQLAHRHGS